MILANTPAYYIIAVKSFKVYVPFGGLGFIVEK